MLLGELDLARSVITVVEDGGFDASNANLMDGLVVFGHPEDIHATIAAIESAGVSAHLTEIEGGDHNCWTAATSQHEIFPWLFAQRRARWNNPPDFAPLQ